MKRRASDVAHSKLSFGLVPIQTRAKAMPKKRGGYGGSAAGSASNWKWKSINSSMWIG
jgi:hypothetical protein